MSNNKKTIFYGSVFSDKIIGKKGDFSYMVKHEKDKKITQKPCRCGSITHKRTNHRKCPLNKNNIK